MQMDVHETLAMKAPITFEIACKAWGDDPNLCDDKTRKCFFAVWALMCFEWAEAMVEEAQNRKLATVTKQRDELLAALEDAQDIASKALRKAWQLGQTYWQQADSEYTSQHRKADETQAKFQQLVDDTRESIAKVGSSTTAKAKP